ncbi:MAG: hypothetical protein KDI64_20280 [Candidatus Accumulibacter sp.]|nr:hypothetical protein [Accumulibacter sp.]
MTASVLALASSQAPAAQEPPANTWRMENATITAVPFVSELVDGKWVQRMPAKNGTLLEVHATLNVDGDGSFGPLSLSDVRLLSGAGAMPLAAELVAVGVGTVKCRYFPAQIDAGRPREAALGAGKEFVLRREDSQSPVLLRTRTPSLDLCMAFEVLGPPPPTLLWGIADRSLPLAVGSLALDFLPGPPLAQQTTDGDASTSRATPPTSGHLPVPWERALSSPLLWGGLALTAVAIVGGIAVLRMRRQTRNAPPGDAVSALDIPRVNTSHQPTAFARVQAEAGPGQRQFQDALAALRLEDWAQATELFGEAITAGLTPTFEAGAWGLRGEALLNCDDLIGASTCFLRALSSPGVTAEAAFPAASQLAAISSVERWMRTGSSHLMSAW